MKKLKEVTDKKETSLLKTIDEKLTEAARELGLSLEQRTVRMKQRDKKVWVPYVSLCRFRVGGGGSGFLLSFAAHLHLLPSPPEESCPRLPQGWLQGGSGLDWKGPAGVAGTGRGTLSVVAELRPGQPGLSVVLVCQSLIS